MITRHVEDRVHSSRLAGHDDRRTTGVDVMAEIRCATGGHSLEQSARIDRGRAAAVCVVGNLAPVLTIGRVVET